MNDTRGSFVFAVNGRLALLVAIRDSSTMSTAHIRHKTSALDLGLTMGRDALAVEKRANVQKLVTLVETISPALHRSRFDDADADGNGLAGPLRGNRPPPCGPQNLPPVVAAWRHRSGIECATLPGKWRM